MLFLGFLTTFFVIFDFARHRKNLKMVDFWFWMVLDLLAMLNYFSYYFATINSEMRASSFACLVLLNFLRALRILLNFKIGR